MFDYQRVLVHYLDDEATRSLGDSVSLFLAQHTPSTKSGCFFWGGFAVRKADIITACPRHTELSLDMRKGGMLVADLWLLMCFHLVTLLLRIIMSLGISGS